MKENEVHIVEAAFEVFSRYGVKRASMSDIAAAADISRQTLYKSFSNKDDLLSATIRLFGERASATIQSSLKTATGLDGKLDVIFEHIALNPYRMLHASPNVEDIVLGMNQISTNEIARNSEMFRKIIEEELTEYEGPLRDLGLTPAGFSDLIQVSASAAKSKATDFDHLAELITSLKKWIIGTVKATDL